MMQNIAYLIKEAGMDYFTVLKLPVSVFFSLLKQFRLFALQQTPEGLELLRHSKSLKQKDPDLYALRNSEFYKK